MPTKSKHKLNNQFANMTSPEAFRAFWKALAEGNHELVDEIERQLPLDSRMVVDSNRALLFQKINLYNLYLIQRANIAISFYNSFLGEVFGIEGAKEMFDPEITKKWLKDSDEVKEQIREIDIKSKNVLSLEFFEILEGYGDHFDYWMELIKKVHERYE